LLRFARNGSEKVRHCEERSDEAISLAMSVLTNIENRHDCPVGLFEEGGNATWIETRGRGG